MTPRPQAGARTGPFTRRAAAGTGVLALTAAVLAACGGTPTAASVVDTAYASTMSANTARFTFTVRFAPSGGASGGTPVSLSGTGVEDFPRHAAQVSTALPGVAGTVEDRLIGSTMYIQVPARMAPRLPGGKSWVSTDLSKQSGRDLTGSSPLGAGGNDPTAVLSFLRSNSTDGVQQVGAQNLDGVATTHYRAAIDFDKALANLPGDASPAPRRLAQELQHRTAPVDVWVDGANHVRRVTMSVDAPASSGVPAGNLTVSADFSDFGVQVSVVAPPPSAVVDLSALTGGA